VALRWRLWGGAGPVLDARTGWMSFACWGVPLAWRRRSREQRRFDSGGEAVIWRQGFGVWRPRIGLLAHVAAINDVRLHVQEPSNAAVFFGA